jgi:hypothetical protein
VRSLWWWRQAGRTSETSVNFYQTSRRNNAEDSHLHTRRRENLVSHNFTVIFDTDLLLFVFLLKGLWHSLHCIVARDCFFTVRSIWYKNSHYRQQNWQFCTLLICHSRTFELDWEVSTNALANSFTYSCILLFLSGWYALHMTLILNRYKNNKKNTERMWPEMAASCLMRRCSR